jgi:glycosyltransferase involved in cell wall biosynthesis
LKNDEYEYPENNEKKQIMYLINQLGYGGAQQLILNIIRNLDHSKYKPIVGMWGGRKDIAEEFEEIGVEVVDFDGKGKADIFAFLRLYNYLKRNKIDFLNTHLSHANIVGRIAGKAAKIPCILTTYHNMYISNHPLSRWLDVATSYMEDMGVAISKGVEKSWYKDSAILSSDALKSGRSSFTIYNGVDIDKINKSISNISPDTKRKEIDVDGDRFTFTCAARLHPVKGHKFLIEAVSHLKKDYPSLCVLLLGDGSLRDSLKSMVKSKDLEKQVRFMGYRKDVYEIMAVSDAFVLPSINEGFGIAIAEAMALSLPVVASDLPSIAEVVEGGETGSLVPPSDSQALAKSMKKYLQNYDLTQAHGKKGFDRVSKKFSMQRATEKYEMLYQYLIKNG